jgi:hypothetical protein
MNNKHSSLAELVCAHERVKQAVGVCQTLAGIAVSQTMGLAPHTQGWKESANQKLNCAVVLPLATEAEQKQLAFMIRNEPRNTENPSTAVINAVPVTKDSTCSCIEERTWLLLM